VSSEGLLVEDLHRAFGDVQALAGVSLHVRPGSVHGFVGANGAGKTTAMRIVVGVDRADRGTVHMDGIRITAEQRARIGYLPEERGLYPDMRVYDQLVFLARLHGMDATAAARRADELLARLGLTERAQDPTTELSLGNQQRVQLAAAIAHQPDLLVLDEPFSGLDPVASDVMADLLLEQAARGVPVLFLSHQLDLVERLCDHVTIIAAGRVVADGGTEELRAARAGRRFRITLAGDHPDWTAQDGVLDLVRTGDEAVLTLADDTDEQVLLDVARHHGRVRHFGRVVPTLTELYREATS
jgi:ABC-2 type transport system ATP-binding protein